MRRQEAGVRRQEVRRQEVRRQEVRRQEVRRQEVRRQEEDAAPWAVTVQIECEWHWGRRQKHKLTPIKSADLYGRSLAPFE
jgi:hypothetical protein